MEWHFADQWDVILLQVSLTEEAFFEVVGLSSVRAIWTAFELAYETLPWNWYKIFVINFDFFLKAPLPSSNMDRNLRRFVINLRLSSKPLTNLIKIMISYMALAALFRLFPLEFRPLSSLTLFGTPLLKPKVISSS